MIRRDGRSWRVRTVAPKRFLAPLAFIMLAVVFVAAPASARTRTIIDVFPGPKAIQNALSGANAGDTLSIHAGKYRESFTVSTPNVTLQAAGDGTVTVDGRCKRPTVIAIRADGVTVMGLRVQGASTLSEIDFASVTGGTAMNDTVIDTCAAADGISVTSSSSLSINSNSASGFSDAGIRLAGISQLTGVFQAQANTLTGNGRGMIVADSVGGNNTFRVLNNVVHDNVTSGVFVTNSTEIRIKFITVTNNGFSGVELDASSNDNRVEYATVSGHTYDLANDGGTGNCFVHDSYVTSFGDISCT